MRTSKKDLILRATLAIVQEGGFTAVTLDSAAARAGVSKGGLLYHFPTRQALIAGARQYLADNWEAGMIAHAGGEAHTLTPSQRLRAYLSAASGISPAQEVAFLLEPRDRSGDHHDPLAEVTARWALPCPPHDAPAAWRTAYCLQLAADGIWLAEAIGDIPSMDDTDSVAHTLIAELVSQIPADLDDVCGELHSAAQTPPSE
ncbi:TetR family transcriptional regulator [Corynebacterium sp. 13CS0277]|uniref:TetR/AcrR family transcriptional regulator n=1 Tax=Corynebacterium sp. 13CS0277 TaxID=2071994 RepID=UPI000D026638|nr:TetR/AcrR family transcriptional regulator [Corynebacterium sp. 13CS0277]PRQ10747.1 TetR family transcriptional regulator [Corynebacterium sp. 13CS0277]